MASVRILGRTPSRLGMLAATASLALWHGRDTAAVRSTRAVSEADAKAASISPSTGAHQPLQTLREALRLCWAAADRFAKRRLLLALAFVAGGVVLAAGTPVALKLIMGSLAQGAGEAGGVVSATSPVFLGLYVLGQYLEQGEVSQREGRPISAVQG